MAFANATFKQTNSPAALAPGEDNYFGNFGADYEKGDFQNIKSNLKITVTKYTCEPDKWGGEMTWFWSFENQKTNRGFITFNKATTNKEKHGLSLTGIFYLMEKEDEEWKVVAQKEVKNSDDKVLTQENFNQYFPKPYWYTWAGKFDKLYYTNWDFIDSADKLDNLCDASEAQGTPTTKTGEWEYQTSQWWETC